MKGWHMLACVVFIALAAVLVAVGAEGFAVLAFAGCALMMGAMVWMMLSGQGGHGHD